MRINIFTGHEAMYLSRDLRTFNKLNLYDVLAFYRIGVSNGDWSRLVGRCVYEEIPIDGGATCES